MTSVLLFGMATFGASEGLAYQILTLSREPAVGVQTRA